VWYVTLVSTFLRDGGTNLTYLKSHLLNIVGAFFLLLHRALWNLYVVHSPTNALFIKHGKV